MIVVMSAVTGAYTFLGSPVKGKSDDKILQIWLQARVPAAVCGLCPITGISTRHNGPNSADTRRG